mmetsp:Transcript_31689/g.88807  ORF Transcript_31689/g.88807 Transcript_31689/m.88807 type:complete len:277 (+) Transcript_31689:128-958(+)
MALRTYHTSSVAASPASASNGTSSSSTLRRCTDSLWLDLRCGETPALPCICSSDVPIASFSASWPRFFINRTPLRRPRRSDGVRVGFTSAPNTSSLLAPRTSRSGEFVHKLTVRSNFMPPISMPSSSSSSPSASILSISDSARGSSRAESLMCAPRRFPLPLLGALPPLHSEVDPPSPTCPVLAARAVVLRSLSSALCRVLPGLPEARWLVVSFITRLHDPLLSPSSLLPVVFRSFRAPLSSPTVPGRPNILDFTRPFPRSPPAPVGLSSRSVPSG